MERERERERESESMSERDFLLHNLLGHPQGVYKMKTLAPIGVEKSVKENFVSEKEPEEAHLTNSQV